MKRIAITASLLAAGLVLTGCSTQIPAGVQDPKMQLNVAQAILGTFMTPVWTRNR